MIFIAKAQRNFCDLCVFFVCFVVEIVPVRTNHFLTALSSQKNYVHLQLFFFKENIYNLLIINKIKSMQENFQSKTQQDFVFSKAVKAGKRIYYFDVRKTRNGDDLFVSVAESKKITGGTEQNPQFSFQKQKITIYKEDLKNFADAIKEVADFVEQAKDIENIKPLEFNKKNYDAQPVEKQNFNANEFYAQQPKVEEQPIEKPEKSGNKFKSMFDDIFGKN